jgi:hypothetical protein
MALVYDDQGDSVKCMELNEKALGILLRTQRDEHLHVSIIYNNMANTILAQGDKVKAMEFYEKAFVCSIFSSFMDVLA